MFVRAIDTSSEKLSVKQKEITNKPDTTVNGTEQLLQTTMTTQVWNMTSGAEVRPTKSFPHTDKDSLLHPVDAIISCLPVDNGLGVGGGATIRKTQSQRLISLLLCKHSIWALFWKTILLQLCGFVAWMSTGWTVYGAVISL